MPGSNSIVGLQSGLDWTAIVDSMITFERQNAVLLENQQVEKTNMVTALKAVQAKFLALNTNLISLKKAGTFEAARVDVSDETSLTATAVGRVGTGSYDIQVQSIARNHQIASQGFTSSTGTDMGTGTIKIKVGSAGEETITIDDNNNSLIGIKNAINDASAGITASIVNDGSSSNPCRLILSANNSGAQNDIIVESNLTDGLNLDYTTSMFDTPEQISFASGTTSEVSLGASASYTGSENKIYTFTVGGSGEQTIGSGAITINWTDGTDSGSIEVNAADTEVQLTGDGGDGLWLSLSAGVLTGGDQFQVSTFAPLIQEAVDAKIAFGSSSGSGSAITVTSETNEFENVIEGLKLSVLKETAVGTSVTINTDVDVNGIKSKINDFIDSYNQIMEYIDDQNSYDSDTGESGVLFGDLSLWTMQNSIRNLASSTVDGIDSGFNQLYTIGIGHAADGQLAIKDHSRFEDALRNNLDEVIKLFGDSGNSSSSYIEFVSATSNTSMGEEFEVDITAAATHGGYEGASLTDPATTAITLDGTNNRLGLKVDGRQSEEIILTEKTYSSSAALVTEIQAQIDADNNIGDRGVTVEWVETGGSGYLVFTGTTYGSGSKIEIDSSINYNAYEAIGLAGGATVVGDDVAGTINGEEAEGSGQFLTGKEGNDKTEGLMLKVTLEEADVESGSEGTITMTRGVAAGLSKMISSLTKSVDGTFDRRIKSCEKQIELYTERIEDIDERLAIRRETLLNQFYEMEKTLSELNAQSEYLTTQLAGLNSNWNFGRGTK